MHPMGTPEMRDAVLRRLPGMFECEFGTFRLKSLYHDATCLEALYEDEEETKTNLATFVVPDLSWHFYEAATGAAFHRRGIVETARYDEEMLLTHTPRHIKAVVTTDEEEGMPSYRSRLGIDNADGERIPLWIDIDADTFAVAGRYHLITDPELTGHVPEHTLYAHDDMFLFRDCSPLGAPEDDAFIFCRDCRRLPDRIEATASQRRIVARMPPGWHPATATSAKESVTIICDEFVPTLIPFGMRTPYPEPTLRIPAAMTTFPTVLNKSLLDDDAMTVLATWSFSDDNTPPVPITMTPSSCSAWCDVTLARGSGSCETAVPVSVAQAVLLLTKGRFPIPDGFGEWRHVDGIDKALDRARGGGASVSDVYAPSRPRLTTWAMVDGKRLEPIEDPHEAAIYERRIRDRPNPMVLQAAAHDDANGTTRSLRLLINPVCLGMRALDGLVPTILAGDEDAPVRVQWRVVPGGGGGEDVTDTASFTVCSNRLDPEAEQPPHFSTAYPLRPEQRRSLHWMLEQERHGKAVEEEVGIDHTFSDPTNGFAGYRLEARAQTQRHIRGGVLADDVGYGKTAVTLALIDAASSPSAEASVATSSLRTVRSLRVRRPAIACDDTTLVIVPKHLTKQWVAEVAKFLRGYDDAVLTIFTNGDIAKLTVQRVREARIVVMAASVLGSKEYTARLGAFALTAKTTATLPERGGRQFDAVYSEILGGIGQAVRIMHDEGPAALRRAREAEEAEEPTRTEEAVVNLVTSKKMAYSRKKAAPAGGGPAKKRARREDEEATTWCKARGVPLEAFAFGRVVIDEFTYLGSKERTVARGIPHRAMWILSGTPPLEGFEDVQSIADFFDLRLGTTEPRLSKKGKIAPSQELSRLEQLETYLGRSSATMHRERRRRCQGFLADFVRQNVAELDEIPCSEEVYPMALGPVHAAVYTELEGLLQELETHKHRSKKPVADREQRIREVLMDAGDATEALMRRAAHLEGDHAMERIVETRRAQFEVCRRQLVWTYHRIACEHAALTADPQAGTDRNMWKDGAHTFVTDFAAEVESGLGDPEVTDFVASVITNAALMADEEPEEEDMPFESRLYAVRQHVHDLRELCKELIGRRRSLRFIVHNNNSSGGGAVLSCCGHTGPESTLREAAALGRCHVPGCSAVVHQTHVVAAATTKSKDTEETKLERVVRDVAALAGEAKDGKDGGIIVFVQFAPLLDQLTGMLREAGVAVATLQGTAHQQSTTLDTFQQQRGAERVLILEPHSASASGANLTCCAHAVFVHPLHLATAAQRRACETQSIGRIRRYGQRRPCHVHRYLVEGTVDMA